MQGDSRSAVLRYGVAAFCIALATGAQALFGPYLGGRFPFAALFFAVLVAAWHGGFGPALAAALLGAVGSALFLLPRPEQGLPPGHEAGAGLLLYLAVSLGIALLGGAMHAARLRAEEGAASAGRSREELRATLQSIGDGVLVTDAQGRITSLNPVAEALTGWPAAEAVGRPLHEAFVIVNEQTRQRAECPVEKVLRLGTLVGLANHTVLIARDGSERPIDDSAAPIPGADGAPVGAVLVFRDITSRRQAEAAARQAQALLAAVIDHAPAYIFAKDRRGRYLLANRSLARMLGAEPGDLPGHTDRDFFAPDVAEQFHRDDQAIIESGQPRIYEESFLHQGQQVTALTVKFPLLDEKGTPYAACGVATDVTELKSAREQLRSTAERLNLALAAARLGDWSWDARTDLVILSPRAADIFGIPPGPHMTWTGLQQLLHEEDRERARLEVERAVAGRGQYEIEYRVNRPDGGLAWVAAMGHAYYAEDGSPVGMVGVVQDVSARKRSEEESREGEARLRLALQAGRMGVWEWVLSTNRVTWSPELERIHGLAPGTFPGTFEAFQSDIHPDDRADVQAAISRALEQGEHHVEYRLTLAGGATRWVEGRGKLFRDEAGRPARMIGVCVDVTERRLARAALERAEQDARFLSGASSTLASLVDDQSTLQKLARLAVPSFADWCAVDLLAADGSLRRLAVAHVDPAKVELAHELHRRLPPDPAAPRGVWHIIRTGKSELVPEITDEMLAASLKDEELLGIFRELGLHSYMGVPLEAHGKVLGVVTFIAAESKRVYTADDLALAEDLAHRAAVAIENARLYQEVREAGRKKDEFLAVLAHELRNPLAPIRNALGIMKLAGANAQLAEQAREMAERQLHSLTRLVNDLLDVSRVMRGQIELKPQSVDIATVLLRAAETARPEIDAAGHEFSVSPPQAPLWVRADVVRLAQAVSNLLHNSARYTDPGGRISLSAEREGDQAVVRVRDTGIGIAPDKLHSIFDLFMQAAPAGERSRGGLGIGLTVVRTLVALHSGTVEAHSDGTGQGSEFAIRLPALEVGPEQERGDALQAAPPTRRRVLVVDDNADAADTLAMLLRLEGHEVRVAHDGPTGVRLAEEAPPELAFLDLGMPGMDGLEVARRFRSSPALSRVRLVALTGWGGEEDRRRTREAGFDHHLVKPAEPEALRRLLAGLAAG